MEYRVQGKRIGLKSASDSRFTLTPLPPSSYQTSVCRLLLHIFRIEPLFRNAGAARVCGRIR